MPRYKVLRAIEHNLKLYLPELPDAIATAKSAGNGSDIPVDASGSIELSESEAAAFIEGQISADDDGRPLPVQADAAGKKKAAKGADDAHFTERGARIVAQSLADYLASTPPFVASRIGGPRVTSWSPRCSTEPPWLAVSWRARASLTDSWVQAVRQACKTLMTNGYNE